MNQEEMLSNLRRVFLLESQFCSDFANLHAKLFTTDAETLYHELDVNNRQDYAEDNTAYFDFQFGSANGTILKTPDGRAHLSDEIWFYKPDHTEPSLIIYLDPEGFPINFTYDPDGIQWNSRLPLHQTQTY